MSLRESTEEIVQKIETGGVGVLPTDTMYGVVASAMDPIAVEKLFALRKRDLNKPFLVIVPSIDDILVFNPDLSGETRSILEKIWPAPVSVEIPVLDSEWNYLTRGTGRFAFRIPDSAELRKLLQKVGPLVAPSVNPEGEAPAETLEEARKYFPNLDFYIEGGTLPNNPSTLISIEGGKAKVYRQGKWQVPDFLL